ncbi:transglutaminase [Rhodobacteraceae bacterium RKSG542]|nr:transglutaminase [Pseudovibrio flavus]
MHVRGNAAAPKGHASFCHHNSEACDARAAIPSKVVLTDQLLKELNAINIYFNSTIKPRDDKKLFAVSEHWTYATSGAGDCEEYVLEKQRRLIELGWPPSALLITVVRERSGGGHAVLTVRTDKGDLILDNQTNKIHEWRSTPYRFVKRQSGENAREWNFVLDARRMAVAFIAM